MVGTYKYRLPTETEWEYARRAHSTTEFSFGTEVDNIGEYAWCADKSTRGTHPVGQKQPNL
jgi:formylglycine-generating enzyme required for sulfatase activity